MIADSALIFDEEEVPYAPRFGDHYYSRQDGRAESRHVFVEGNDLTKRWNGQKHFAIGELGFGTGLNLLETWIALEEAINPPQRLEFWSLEAFPIGQEDVKRALARWPELQPKVVSLLENWEALQNGPVDLSNNLVLNVIFDGVEEALPRFSSDIDAWFLDGFAPDRNPDMWSPKVMDLIGSHSQPGTTIATFSVAGMVRRNLQAAGFEVSKRPGYGRKREMLTATFRAKA